MLQKSGRNIFWNVAKFRSFAQSRRRHFRFSSLGGPESCGPAVPGGQAGGPPGRPAIRGRHTPGQGQEQEEEKKGEGIAACCYVVVMKEKKEFY